MVKIAIFLNGNYDQKEFYINQIKKQDILISVDGGTDFLFKIKKLPDMLIGDLDSIGQKSLSWVKKNGIKILRYPEDKDYSDFELALKEAISLRPDKITVFGGFGKRRDHEYSSLMVASKYSQKMQISLEDKSCSLFFAREGAKNIIPCKKGDTVSLIPFSYSVKKITSHGLKWVLKGETIFRSESRTLSNEAVSGQPYFYLSTGLLLVVVNKKS